jgi:hypothetical protein
MKTFQRFCGATFLALALALFAFAGEIPTPGAKASPQQQPSATMEIGFSDASATGEMSAPGVEALDPATEAVLSLLQSLLSLF